MLKIKWENNVFWICCGKILHFCYYKFVIMEIMIYFCFMELNEQYGIFLASMLVLLVLLNIAFEILNNN